MADSNVIGKVSSASGEVKVTGADGQQKSLNVGDEIHANDVVATGADSSVIFEFADGSRKGMPANAEITLNNSVYNPATAEEPASEGISTGDVAEEEVVEAPEAAAGAEPIGTLSSGSGEITAKALDGSERALEQGDPVYAGETVVTGDGSLAIFELSDGSRKGLASNAEIYLEESILTPQTELAEADVPTIEQVEAEMAAEPSAAGVEAEAAPAEPIGFIKASSGEITAVGADGAERQLADGDEVFAGDTILSADASTAIIEYTDGATSGLSSNSEITLDARPAAEPAQDAAAETAIADAGEAGAEGIAADEAAAEQVALGTGIPVGTVSAADGDVIAVGADGSERKLEVGDEVNADETVMAGDNSTAIFNFYDGSSRGLASNSEMTLDGNSLDLAAIKAGTPEGAGAVAEAEEVAPAGLDVAVVTPAAAQPQATEGAVAAVEELDEDVAAIQQAIEEGADPSEEAEATAAGEEGADGGHDAVFLARSGQKGLVDSGYNTDDIGLGAPVFVLREDDETAEFVFNPSEQLPVLPTHTLVAVIKAVIDTTLTLVDNTLGNATTTLRTVSTEVREFFNDPDITNILNAGVDEVQRFATQAVQDVQGALGDLLPLVGPTPTDGQSILSPEGAEAFVRGLGEDSEGRETADSGVSGEGAQENASLLTTAFLYTTVIGDQLNRAGLPLEADDYSFQEANATLQAGVEELYGDLSGPAQATVNDALGQAVTGIEMLDEAQDPLIGEDSQVNAIETQIQSNEMYQSGEQQFTDTFGDGGALNIGERQEGFVHAVADEIRAEDGSGVVQDLRGAEDSELTDGGNRGGGTVVGETYDVLDETADVADTLLVGSKIEDGEEVRSGGGVIADSGEGLQSATMPDYSGYQENIEKDVSEDLLGQNGGDGDLQDVGEAAAGFVADDVGGSLGNIADAGGDATATQGDGLPVGTPEVSGAELPTFTTTSSAGASNFDVPGVNQGATSNLMGDSSTGTVTLQSIHVAAEHDSAVFHLSTEELAEGEGGFDINNFHTDTDTLEIADLLGEAGQALVSGGEVNGDSLAQLLHVEDDGEGGATISVSDGAGGSTAIHLKGVDLTHDENGDLRSDAEIIDSMLAGGSLDVTNTGTQMGEGTLDPGSLFG